ncbi:hypothetical protein EZV73_26975 [Acidaminobacter sp. JC074]|uniref:hypothetical protein n=1 Tax=Acidaminobacter sp. JC074 TaxID=2530199 RepID=UPI001F0E6C45|nr:hypothetical protein [Acidaminobacter sp. JC074]MCH4891243.1 hypothetical protein [Acidaminobacter sp. JC074]
MYKISEVAEMLSIEKVKIFEALIVHDEVLSPFVIKERHLSYITEDGVKELERLVFGIVAETEEEYIEESVAEEASEETDHLDEFIEKTIRKKEVLRNEIIDLKRQINMLDKELRMKDEAIQHYQNIFEDDINWMMSIDKKIEEEISTLKVEEKKSGFFNKLMK